MHRRMMTYVHVYNIIMMYDNRYIHMHVHLQMYVRIYIYINTFMYFQCACTGTVICIYVYFVFPLFLFDCHVGRDLFLISVPRLYAFGLWIRPLCEDPSAFGSQAPLGVLGTDHETAWLRFCGLIHR